MPLYLGGVLIITRIIYYALGAKEQLPLPISIPHDVVAKHHTPKMPKDVPRKEKKKKQPTKEEGDSGHRPTTRSATQ